MDEFLGWRTDRPIASNYVSAIDVMLSSDSAFANFRRAGGDYTNILEHMTARDGQVYLDYIRNIHNHLLKNMDEFKKNDSVGNPYLSSYPEVGLINPTTLRYIKFAGDIQYIFGNLDGYDLVEIGGGYGGLVRILSSMHKFNTIKLFDLPNPLKLQKRYLSKFGIDVETYTIQDDFVINKKTLVVSNYAWCECDRPTRDLYKEKIINKADNTYMVVYDVDVDGELMSLDGDKRNFQETLNPCRVFTLKK